MRARLERLELWLALLEGPACSPVWRCYLAERPPSSTVIRGRLREAILPVAVFAAAEQAFLVNSLRGWIRVERITAPP